MSFLQVASWNIEHLSGHPRAARRQSAYALADHIEMAGVDMIALQEVYVTAADEEVRISERGPVVPSCAHTSLRNSDLDVVCHILEEHLDDPWRYIVLPNRQGGDRSQLCAMMWNTRRATLKSVLPLGVSHEDGELKLWDRKPHLLAFLTHLQAYRKSEDGVWVREKENREISIVPLHMKSNHGGATVSRKVRAKEAETLCNAIKAREGEFDPSLMLLGDTNILNNAEPAIEVFVDRGFVDLNNNDSSTYWSKDYGDSPFDRIFLAPGRPEFKYSRQYVLRSSDLQQHDRFLSDHYMIKVSVKDYVDDTDPRN